MIRIILKGGLGNQMFQYALGKSLALKYDVPLMLDLSFLTFRIPLKGLTPHRDFTYRDYSLDIFDIKEQTTNLFGNSTIDKHLSYPLLSVYNRLFNNNYFLEGENFYALDEKALKVGSNAVLEGYWQNFNYFAAYEEEIKETFDIDKLYDPNYKDLDEKISQQRNSVALHLRRDDFLNKKHQQVYARLTENYFKQAINKVLEQVAKPQFYIFGADEESWIRSWLPLDGRNYTVIKKETSGFKDRSHFRFMSLCKHNIISNSTYAWWSAYLNKNKEKIVITPSRWTKKFEFENVPGWIKLDL